jgi:hypothetical protein
MVAWSGCGGARSPLTLSLTPKRSTSWLSPNPFFATPPFAIAAFFLCSSLRIFFFVRKKKEWGFRYWLWLLRGGARLLGF